MDNQERSSLNNIELVKVKTEEAPEIAEDEDSLDDEYFSIEAIDHRIKRYRVLDKLMDTQLAVVAKRLGPPPPYGSQLDPDLEPHLRQHANFAYIDYCYDKLIAEDRVITKMMAMIISIWQRPKKGTQVSKIEPNDQIPSTSHDLSHVPKEEVASPPETLDLQPSTSRAHNRKSVALTPRPRAKPRRAAINATYKISRIFNKSRGKITKQSCRRNPPRNYRMPKRFEDAICFIMLKSPNEHRSICKEEDLRKAAGILATISISRNSDKPRGKITQQSGGAIDRKRRSPQKPRN